MSPEDSRSDDGYEPPAREILAIAHIHHLDYEQARQKLLRDHADGRRALAAYVRKMDASPESVEFLKSLPAALAPKIQWQLPNWLGRFKAYAPSPAWGEPAYTQALTALAKAYDWALRTARGEVVGLVLWSKETRLTRRDEKTGEEIVEGFLGYGCGKTHLARAAEEVLYQCKQFAGPPQSWRFAGQFFSAVDMVSTIQSTYRKDSGTGEDDLFRAWRKGWFILDDLGKEHVKEESEDWWQSKLYSLINSIHESHSFLLTTNLSASQLEALLGQAAFTRLWAMCGESGFVNMSSIPNYRFVLGDQRDARPLGAGADRNDD